MCAKLQQRDAPELDRWESYLIAVKGRATATAARYRGLVDRLLRDVGRPFSEINREDIEAHLRRLYLAGKGESVRQGVVVAIRSLGEWSLAHGLVAANPAAGLSGPRRYRREIKVLTVAEVSRLLWGDRPGTLPKDARSLRNRCLLGVAYVAGLRASEIGPLEAEGVQWHEATSTFSVLIRRGKAAGGDVRQPLDRAVSRLLGAYLAIRPAGRYLWGRPLSRAMVRKILRRRLDEAGIAAGGRRFSPHILRHSIATHLLAAGHDIRTVQLFMRHASISTTELYLHADAERLGRALARRSPLDGKRRVPRLQQGFQALLGELQELAGPGVNKNPVL